MTALHLWIVAATFGDSASTESLVLGAKIAPDEKTAVALTVAQFCQESGVKAPLVGLAVREIERDFLEAALREIAAAAAEKDPPAGALLQLVPRTEDDPNAA